MKRLTAVLLLLSMLAGTFAGCSDNSANSDEPAADNTTTPSAEEAAEEEETVLTDGLPETNMGGFELNILHHSQEWLAWANNVLEAEEQTGEILNDAIYNRTDVLQERFSAKIVTETRSQVGADVISQLAMSGDTSYDLCMTYDLWITGMIQYLADMQTIPYISLDQQ